jgi:phenylalanyl-tRNA synthetase beta chain
MEEAKSDLFGAHSNQNKKSLTLANPISADLSVMRPSILPNLIDAAARNTDKGYPDTALFEIGGIYKSVEQDGQWTVAAGLRTGRTETRHWSQAARAVDALDVKGDVLAVLEACGVNTGNLQTTLDAPEWYHTGRSGVLRLGAIVVAHFGEIHPTVLAALKRDEPFAGFEIFLQTIPQAKKKTTRKELLKPSPFQPLSRDFAFIVDGATEAEKILRAVKAVDKTLITAVEIFDVYTGKGIETGKKSIGLAVTLQPVDKTLTDEDITALSDKIIANVQKQTGGLLRA